MFVQFLTCCFCIVSFFVYFSSFLILFFPINKVGLGVTKCPDLHYGTSAQLASVCSCNICRPNRWWVLIWKPTGQLSAFLIIKYRQRFWSTLNMKCHYIYFILLYKMLRLIRCVANTVVTFATSSILNLHFSVVLLLITLMSGDIRKPMTLITYLVQIT